MEHINLEDIKVYRGNDRVFILNTQNFHWVKMSDAFYKSYESDKQTLYKKLHKNFQLFEPELQEQNIRSIYYSVTGRCNMSCEFCALGCGPEISTDDDLTFEELKNIILPKLKKTSLKHIVITGGEPTIRTDLLKIIELFSSNFGKNKIVLQTNGLLLNETLIANLSKYISLIEISIENIFENKNLYTKMIKLFSICRKYHILLQLSFVADQNSKKYVTDALDICYEHEASLLFRIIAPLGKAANSNLLFSTEETLQIYISLIDYVLKKKYFTDNIQDIFNFSLQPRKYCGAYGNILTIRPDGSLTMCSNLTDNIFNLGNIKLLSMKQIQENIKHKIETPSIQNIFLLDNHSCCNNCDVKYFCSGPCAAEANNMDNFSQIKSKCDINRTLIKYMLFVYNKTFTFEQNIRDLKEYLQNHINSIQADIS